MNGRLSKRSLAVLFVAMALLSIACFSGFMGLPLNWPAPESVPEDAEEDSSRGEYANLKKGGNELSQQQIPSDGNLMQKGVGEQASIRESLLSIIGSEERPAWSTYSTAVNVSRSNSVPMLRLLLRDPGFRNRWAQISRITIWLSEEDDEATLDAVLEYVRRPDSWSESDTPEAAVHYTWKAVAMGELGLLKIDRITDTLRETLIEASTVRIIDEWIDMPHPRPYDEPRRLINLFRGQAARGLVLSQDRDNIQLVSKVMEEYVHAFQSEQYLEEELTRDSGYDMQMLFMLIDAIAENDMIVEMGLDDYIRVIDTEEGAMLKSEYVSKYISKIEYNEGKCVMDPCPFCGKSRTNRNPDGIPNN